MVSETVAIPFRLRGESTTTYASSKLNRVGRRAARYDSGLLAHKHNRPAHKRLTPHRIAHGQIACSRSRCRNLSTIDLSSVNIHSKNFVMQPTPKHNHARYDAENRLTAVDGGSTATYVYNGSGQRVAKTTSAGITEYLYDEGWNVVVDIGPNGLPNNDYVYLNGSLLAEYQPGTTYFIHKDHLGSTRVMTAMNGSVYDSMDYLPFGEQIAGGSGSSHKFTGKERDAESGLDNFEARYMSSSLGRFMSPDDTKYSILADPQTLNLYTYVANNPINSVDPTGHDPNCRACHSQHLDEGGNVGLNETAQAEDEHDHYVQDVDDDLQAHEEAVEQAAKMAGQTAQQEQQAQQQDKGPSSSVTTNTLSLAKIQNGLDFTRRALLLPRFDG
jgi:RHS repeat-associated protein